MKRKRPKKHPSGLIRVSNSDPVAVDGDDTVTFSTDAPPPLQTADATLEGMPSEIKLMIFRLLLVSDQPVLPFEETPFYHEVGTPKLLRVCKSIHHMAASLLYRENVFGFRNLAVFKKFSSTTKSYRRLVRHGSSRLRGEWVASFNKTRLRELLPFRSLKTLSFVEGEKSRLAGRYYSSTTEKPEDAVLVDQNVLIATFAAFPGLKTTVLHRFLLLPGATEPCDQCKGHHATHKTLWRFEAQGAGEGVQLVLDGVEEGGLCDHSGKYRDVLSGRAETARERAIHQADEASRKAMRDSMRRWPLLFPGPFA